MDLCDLVDDIMLRGSSVVSRKWNEYTGSTKYVLADVLNAIAPAPVIGANIFQVVSNNGVNDIVHNTLLSIAFVSLSGINYSMILDSEKIENERSISESMLVGDLYNQYMLKIARRVFAISAIAAGIYGVAVKFTSPESGFDEGLFAAATGAGVFSAMYYIMSTDYLSPVRGKIRSAYDYVSAKVSSVFSHPLPDLKTEQVANKTIRF